MSIRHKIAAFLLLALGLQTFALSSVRAEGWVTECVDCPRSFADMTDRSLALDGDGRPHVAYGGDNLYYAWHDGIAWHYETADPTPGVGRDASLALGKQGNPHIAYLDAANKAVKYAYRDALGWHTATVDPGSDISTRHISLALDSNDYPHLTYYLAEVGLRYVYQDAAGWHEPEDLAALGSAGSLRLDATDRPHVAYAEEATVKCAYKDHLGWHTEVVDARYSENLSLALDSNGRPHVSYYFAAGYDLMYAYKDHLGWHPEIVDGEEGWAGRYSSLALDADDRPHISYEGDGDLKYAHKDLGGWHLEVVAAEGDAGLFTSIALDEEGAPWISHLEWTGQTLNVVRLVAGSWESQLVDHAAVVGMNSSAAMDAGGTLHVSYVQQDEWTSIALMYARRDPSGWLIECIDSSSIDAGHSSLALDEDGNPYISYYIGGELRYAFKDAGHWQSELVAVDGSHGYREGGYTSLALDKDGYGHISYHRADMEALSYAYQDADGWHNEVVIWTSDKIMGKGTALSLHPDGYPRIAFRVGEYEDDFGYAYKDSAGWHVVFPKTEGQVGYGISMALDANGFPHASYYNWTQGMIEYAYLDPMGWHFESIEPATFGFPTSLALDATGRVHVAYHQGLTGELRLAHRD
ncbi:MAG: hypothetical protein GX597_20580, partial [Anaerolineaceae bacterium]|nr:hypothetical protein [Anaerolineaceae bacterium]